MSPLSTLFGAVVGVALGMTGGGGAILAVPLLVYGLKLPSREAVSISLITVGASAVVGLVQRIPRGTVEFRTGLLFAVAGMLTAPFGAWLSHRIPEAVLLLLFGGLMLVIAGRMLWTATRGAAASDCARPEDAGTACRRDPAGQLRLTSRCAGVLAGIGLTIGVLTGLFGVGGGIFIVPALVAISGMEIQRAIGTSMLVVALVSLTGIVSHLAEGLALPIPLAASFLLGGVLGMLAGTAVARRIPPARLQQVFAGVVLVMAVLVIVRELGS